MAKSPHMAIRPFKVTSEAPGYVPPVPGGRDAPVADSEERAREFAEIHATSMTSSTQVVAE